MLFEVAIIEQPTEKQKEDGQCERLVFGPKPVVAKDRDAAIATVMQGEKIEADPGRMEVLVRPFAR
jgi:hypothetical protein